MPPNTDPNRLETKTVLKDGVPVLIEDAYLQSTFRKPVPPEEVLTNRRTERRTVTGVGEASQRQCRDVADVELYDQPWGTYWIVQYTVQKKRSGWYYFGVGLVVVGGIVLIATGVGAWAGAGLIVTTVGTGAAATTTLTVTGTLLLAGSTTALGAGVSIAFSVPDGYEKGAPIGSGVYVDFPMGPKVKVGEELNRTIRDWYPC